MQKVERPLFWRDDFCFGGRPALLEKCTKKHQRAERSIPKPKGGNWLGKISFQKSQIAIFD